MDPFRGIEGSRICREVITFLVSSQGWGLLRAGGAAETSLGLRFCKGLVLDHVMRSLYKDFQKQG